jgi:hypothetical protein
MAAKKSANKTVATKASVEAFVEAQPAAVRRDCETLIAMLKKVTGEKPKMWGKSMVGFGDHHYKYASGREGDTFLIGFAPRAKNLTIYVMPGFADYEKQLEKLGNPKTGVGCLYLDTLEGKDLKALESMLSDAAKKMRKRS